MQHSVDKTLDLAEIFAKTLSNSSIVLSTQGYKLAFICDSSTMLFNIALQISRYGVNRFTKS